METNTRYLSPICDQLSDIVAELRKTAAAIALSEAGAETKSVLIAEEMLDTQKLLKAGGCNAQIVGYFGVIGATCSQGCVDYLDPGNLD